VDRALKAWDGSHSVGTTAGGDRAARGISGSAMDNDKIMMMMMMMMMTTTMMVMMMMTNQRISHGQ